MACCIDDVDKDDGVVALELAAAAVPEDVDDGKSFASFKRSRNCDLLCKIA
jgi:hypothetical protein